MLKANYFRPPSPPRMYTKAYKQWRGVYFTNDETLLDESHSPAMQNLVRDTNGDWEKRLGWRTLHALTDRINGIYHLVTSAGVEKRLVHAGSKLYAWTDSAITLLSSGLNNAYSTAFSKNGKLYLLDGANYWVYDGATLAPVTASVFIPTTIIGRAPTGGGTAFEAVNLLGAGRKNSFIGTAAVTAYQLDSTNLDATAVTATVNGAAKAETTDFTVNRTTGIVTFTAAPGAPAVPGTDNVVITFYKTVPGYADRIKKCTIWTFYGIGNNTRVFVSGNPDYKNRDWYSGLDDATYFPDTSYTSIGADSSAIMGYHKLGSSLLILKEDNEQDATVFERTAEFANNSLSFSLQQGVTGVGALAKRSFSNLRDDPLFVSKQGIEGISSYYMETRKTIQNRSFFVNAQLTKETNLNNAVSVIWKGYYLLCVNSHCYVADSTMKTGKNTSDSETYHYEFAYWTNIPAVSFFELNDELYFGTADGKLCKFNTDRLNVDGKIAMNAYSDDGEAIDASLATILDDDGDFMRYKTVPMNGSGVLVKPFTYSSIAVTAVDETSNALTVGSTETGIFDFSDINFDNFTFNTSTSPVAFPFSTLIQGYQRLRYIVRNNVVDEGFGLTGIIKRYYYAGYVR